MKEVDEELLNRVAELTFYRFTKEDDINDLVDFLVEEIETYKNKINELENPPLEDFDDPRWEYGY